MSIFRINLEDTLRTHRLCDSAGLLHPEAYTQVGHHLKDIARRLPRVTGPLVEPQKLNDCRSHDTIFVAGARGSGKTTFVTNVEPALHRLGFELNEIYTFLPPLDPTLVEKWEPFLACVVGHVLNHTSPDEAVRTDGRGRHGVLGIEEFYRTLDAVVDALHSTRQVEKARGYDQISDLQASLQLAELLHEFFRAASHINNCHALVLPIDDVDMAAQHGFQVLEVIRRYLSSPHIVLIVSGDLPLYEHLVGVQFCSELKGENRCGRVDFESMVDRIGASYLEKIFPTNFRVKLLPFKELLRRHCITFSSSRLKSRQIDCRLIMEVMGRALHWGLASRHYRSRMVSIVGDGNLRAALQFFVSQTSVIETIGEVLESWLAIRSRDALRQRIAEHPFLSVWWREPSDDFLTILMSEIADLRRQAESREIQEEDLMARKAPLLATAVAAHLVFDKGAAERNSFGQFLQPIADYLTARGGPGQSDDDGASGVRRMGGCVRGGRYLTRLAAENTLRRFNSSPIAISLSHTVGVGTGSGHLAYFHALMSHDVSSRQPAAFPARFLHTLFASFDQAPDPADLVERLLRNLQDILPGQEELEAGRAKTIVEDAAPIDMDAVRAFLAVNGERCFVCEVYGWQRKDCAATAFVTIPQMDMVLSKTMEFCRSVYDGVGQGAAPPLRLGSHLFDMCNRLIVSVEQTEPLLLGGRKDLSLAHRLRSHPLVKILEDKGKRKELDQITLSGGGSLLDSLYAVISSIRIPELSPGQYNIAAIERDVSQFLGRLQQVKGHFTDQQLRLLRSRIEDRQGRAHEVLTRLHDRMIFDVIRDIGEALGADPDEFLATFARPT